ncbi:MAG: hypothetical protein ACTSR8_20880 [Promethearchaeota archaeon]
MSRDKLLDLLREKEEYEKLKYYSDKTHFEKSITEILRIINRNIKKEAKKLI